MLRTCVVAICVVSTLAGCGSTPRVQRDAFRDNLIPIATSDRQWTGVAVSDEERIFVNYPRWSDDVPTSVAELKNGRPEPYPNAQWNDWTMDKDPATHWVCVQSVFVDDQNRLWVLDPANPKMEGVVFSGPKLVQIDLTTNEVVRTYHFEQDIARSSSYLNDVRIDTGREIAYITDSGDSGIVVLDLRTGEARRVLDNAEETEADDITLTIEGEPWYRNGERPRIHSDGVALTPDKQWLYFMPLTGRELYRIRTEHLLDETRSASRLENDIDTVGQYGACDGLICDEFGWVYLSNIEMNAIRRVNETGTLEVVARDPRISWPDSFGLGPDGDLYFTTSRIHEGANPDEDYAIYKLERRR